MRIAASDKPVESRGTSMCRNNLGLDWVANLFIVSMQSQQGDGFLCLSSSPLLSFSHSLSKVFHLLLSFLLHFLVTRARGGKVGDEPHGHVFVFGSSLNNLPYSGYVIQCVACFCLCLCTCARLFSSRKSLKHYALNG